MSKLDLPKVKMQLEIACLSLCVCECYYVITQKRINLWT